MTEQKKILNSLPRGTVSEVAKTYGVSRLTIYRKLAREEWADPAIIRLLEISEQESSARQKVKKRIKALPQ